MRGSETKSDRTRKPVYTRRVATREMPDRSWPSSQGVGIYRVGRTHLATDAHHDAARPFLDRDPILCMYLATRRGKRGEWEGGEISSEISKKKSLAAMAILFFFFFFWGDLVARQAPFYLFPPNHRSTGGTSFHFYYTQSVPRAPRLSSLLFVVTQLSQFLGGGIFPPRVTRGSKRG